MEDSIIKEVIKKRFLAYKELGEKAIAQLDDTQVYWKYQKSDNSIVIIVKHLHGNMLSRFTDFLNSDGEKEWRNRDAEFSEGEKKDQNGLLKLWEEGWNCVLDAVESLSDENLLEEVTIRGEPHLVLDALLRQIAHYAYHVGQIVYIAKSLKGDAWMPLSIPKNTSQEFNRQMKQKYE